MYITRNNWNDISGCGFILYVVVNRTSYNTSSCTYLFYGHRQNNSTAVRRGRGVEREREREREGERRRRRSRERECEKGGREREGGSDCILCTSCGIG